MRNVNAVVLKKLDEGLSPDVALKSMPKKVARGLALELLEHGANPLKIAELMGPELVDVYLQKFIERGVSPDTLVKLTSLKYQRTLEILDRAGVSKSLLISELFAKEEAETILARLEWLYKNGYEEYIDLDDLVSRLSAAQVRLNLRTLLWLGVDETVLLSKLERWAIIEQKELLLEAGITIKQLARAMGTFGRIDNFRFLVSHGAKIRLNRELKRCSGGLTSLREEDVEAMLYYGADVFTLAELLSPKALIRLLPILTQFHLEKKTTITRLLTADEIVENILTLYDAGFRLSDSEIAMILRCAKTNLLAEHFLDLLKIGLSVEELVEVILPRMDEHVKDIASKDLLTPSEKAYILENLSPRAIIRNLEYLEEAGFKIDIQKLADSLNLSERCGYLQELLTRGAKINLKKTVRMLSDYQVSQYFTLLLERGVDPNYLVNRARSEVIRENLDLLLKKRADPNIIALALNGDDFLEVKDKLLAHGADMWLK